MFTPIWGNNPSPINIPNSTIGNTGISTSPIKPFGSMPAPISGLGNIPIQDVFFSDKSFRAQLYRYLASLQGSPWMFSYAKNEKKSLWDLFLKSNEAILMITPISEQEHSEDQHSKDQADHENEPETAIQTIELEAEENLTAKPLPLEPTALKTGGTLPTFSLPLDPNLPIAMTLPQASEWMLSVDQDNPFALVLENALEKTTIEQTTFETHDDLEKLLSNEVVQVASHPEASTKQKGAQIQLQQIFGQYLDNELYNQLTDAYEKSKDSPEKCLWVRHIEDKLQILGTESPTKYGYKRVDYQWFSSLLNKVAPLAEQYLDCTTGKTFLTCPNGGMVNLQPHGWHDKEERVASLFQVKRLPNGKWFRITAVEHETRMSVKDTEAIKKTLEDWNQTLEQMGWLRETNPLHPSQASSPLI